MERHEHPPQEWREMYGWRRGVETWKTTCKFWKIWSFANRSTVTNHKIIFVQVLKRLNAQPLFVGTRKVFQCDRKLGKTLFLSKFCESIITFLRQFVIFRNFPMSWKFICSLHYYVFAKNLIMLLKRYCFTKHQRKHLGKKQNFTFVSVNALDYNDLNKIQKHWKCVFVLSRALQIVLFFRLFHVLALAVRPKW